MGKYYFRDLINSCRINIIYLVVLILLWPALLLPCNVPVFRYAIERWTADPYLLRIFYNGDLDEAHEKMMQELRGISFDGDSTLNLKIIREDVRDGRDIPGILNNSKLTSPLMILSYPEQTGLPYPVWMGELTGDNLTLLANSPARQIISKFLLSEGTAMFVFLECSDDSLNQLYFDIAQGELEEIATRVKIPGTGVDISGNPIEIEDFKDVHLNFSLLKVSRQDRTEEMFVKMLLGTESDLKDYNLPMIFPIFGQGRSLYALVGSGINKRTLEKACQSLVAWCSCEIKALHQGVDLLFQENWKDLQGETWIKDEEMPALSGLSDFISDPDSHAALTIQVEKMKTNADSSEMQKRRLPENSMYHDTASASPLQREDKTDSQISKNIIWILLVLLGFVIALSVLIGKNVIRIKQ